MQKDYKIGMLVGLAVVVIIGVFVSSRRGTVAEGISIHPPQSPPKSVVADSPTGEKTQRTIQPPPDAPVATEAKKEPTANSAERTHIVKSGETLSEIAGKYYGSAAKWQKIFQANRTAIRDANRLKPGLCLTIPQ